MDATHTKTGAGIAAENDRKAAEGHVPSGWTPESWRRRLHQLADACGPYVPDKAVQLRVWADNVKVDPPAPLPPSIPLSPSVSTPPRNFERY
ncbi:MAG: hypothetical protein ABII12_10940 [Planctomycetota bacterium]